MQLAESLPTSRASNFSGPSLACSDPHKTERTGKGSEDACKIRVLDANSRNVILNSQPRIAQQKGFAQWLRVGSTVYQSNTFSVEAVFVVASRSSNELALQVTPLS